MKKNHLMKTGLWALCLAATMAVYADEEKEEKVTLDQVPQIVKDALKPYAAEADVKGVEKGDQDGTKVYEFDIQQGTHKFEVAISTDGKYQGQEEDVELSSIPAAAQKALNDKAAGGKISGCEKATDKDGKVTYEADIEKDGKKAEVAVDAAGKVATTEDAEEKGKEKEKKEKE